MYGSSFAKKIHTFYSIDISQNSLVLCDIDDTLLVFPKCPEAFYNEAYDYYTNIGYNAHLTKKFIYNDWELNRYFKKPSITDKEGFFHLLERIEKTNSTLCFLTARSGFYHQKTINDLEKVNINGNKFKIYYTNGSVKGDYIKQNINLLDYNNVIFVDDNNDQLENVNKEVPFITCYKFIHIDNNPEPNTITFN